MLAIILLEKKQETGGWVQTVWV